MAGNSLLDLIMSPAAAGERPANALASVADLPGVPTGLDGAPGPTSAQARQMQEEAARRRAQEAFISYGDTTIVPSLSELGNSALETLASAGDAAMAFGPAGELISLPAGAVKAAVGALRGPARAAPVATDTIQALKGEVDQLIEQGRRLGVDPGPMPSMPRSPDETSTFLTNVRDNLSQKIAQKQSTLDATNASAPKTSVPSIDTIAPRRERDEILDFLQGNPYVQPIPGRQGMPTKQEQVDLARQYFERGGRLPEAGPWGRDVPGNAREILQREAFKADGRTGPRQLPGNQDEMIEALKANTKKIRELEGQVRIARPNEVEQLRRQLDAERQVANNFVQLLQSAERGASPIDVPARPPPRIFRNEAGQ